MENEEEGLTDHLFVNLQLFLEGVHKEIVKDVHKIEKEMPKQLARQIVFFDEEVYRFLSTLSQYYSIDELKEKISNWDYFQNKIEEFASSPNITIHRSYALKFLHNKAEKEKAEADKNYEPKYYSG